MYVSVHVQIKARIRMSRDPSKFDLLLTSRALPQFSNYLYSSILKVSSRFQMLVRDCHIVTMQNPTTSQVALR